MSKKGVLFIAVSLIVSTAMSSIRLDLKEIRAENILTGQIQSVSLIDTKNPKNFGTVVIFMSAKCPCSGSHTDIIKELAKKYSDFQFIGIHSNTDEANKITEEYFKKVQFPFAILQDQDAKIADIFKAFKTPHAFLINGKGEVIYQGGVTNSSNASSADKNFLADALADTVAGKPIQTPLGRTLGCVILRK
ncbi:MAG: redoxin family protein [Pseudobdellovibrio sp.]